MPIINFYTKFILHYDVQTDQRKYSRVRCVCNNIIKVHKYKKISLINEVNDIIQHGAVKRAILTNKRL